MCSRSLQKSHPDRHPDDTDESYGFTASPLSKTQAAPAAAHATRSIYSDQKLHNVPTKVPSAQTPVLLVYCAVHHAAAPERHGRRTDDGGRPRPHGAREPLDIARRHAAAEH